MLLSMTGYGDASFQHNGLTISVELRALNNRYLKVSLRANEPYNLLESECEKLIRKSVKRGTVQVSLRCYRPNDAQEYQVNQQAFRSYLTQLQALGKECGFAAQESWLGQVLALPGVIPETMPSTQNLEADWPSIEKALSQALSKLQAMRKDEGQAMAQELIALRAQIEAHLSQIRKLAPRVVELYRDRVLERVKQLVSQLGVSIQPSDLIKEVSIFAERSDIAEELVRLSSHLEQFQLFIQEPESSGRKLEFLTQEMSREANTIGSKASDIEISKHVVEIKGALEKIRELIQNVE